MSAGHAAAPTRWQYSLENSLEMLAGMPPDFWHGDTSNGEFQAFSVALSAPPASCRRQSLTEGERGERE
jgi:hypothetical protein